MKNSIEISEKFDYTKPIGTVRTAEYKNICGEFSTGYDPRDGTCIRCHLQLLCMMGQRTSIIPERIEQIKKERSIKYFLDENKGYEFEEYFQEICADLIEIGGIEIDKFLSAIADEYEDMLRLSDPEIPNIMLQRIERDLRFEVVDGKILVKTF